MEKYLTKVRHIMPVLALMTIGTVVAACLIRLSAFQFNLFELKEDVWSLWIPMLLPWIPITVWLRPKLRILIRKKDSDRMQFGYQFLAWFVIGAPLLVSQHYLDTAIGEIEELKDFSSIQITSHTRFITISDFEVVTEYGTSSEDIRTSGKYNEHLDISLFFAAPISKNTTEPTFSYWYGVKFKEQISNRLSNSEKEEKYKSFFLNCIKKMNNYPFYDAKYFRVAPKSDDKEVFLRAVEKKMRMKIEPIILLPETKKFDERNGDKLFWIFGSTGIGLVVFLLFLALPRYSVMELERQRKGRKPQNDEVVEMFRYLIPKEPHFATSVILDINILVCLVMIISGVNILYPNGMELMQWGANRRFETTNGEFWRLITSMFVHGGVVHLLLNIFGLYLGGSFLEMIYGAKRYALVYISSGLVAGMASILWNTNVASVGASGAIFGVFGAILSFVFDSAFEKGGKRVILFLFGPYVGINLLFGFVGLGIDNAGHVGGLACGFLMGVVINRFFLKSISSDSSIEEGNR